MGQQQHQFRFFHTTDPTTTIMGSSRLLVSFCWICWTLACDRGAIHVHFVGWRHLPHSYALVCQNFLLQFARLSFEGKDLKIHLSFEDYPKPTDWLQVKGLFSEEDTSIISSIPRKTDQPDVVLRFGYPIDLTHLPSPTRVLSLATAEYGTSDIFRTPGSPPWSNPGNVTLMVPSHWSINLFQDFEDIPSSNLLYLPHGFDSSYFYPSTKRSKLCKECLKFRESLGISSSAFIFLNTGAATMNKNIILLIQSFARISVHYQSAILLLKSLTDLYPQGVDNIHRAVSGLPHEVISRIIWLDKTSSNEYLASLYRCSNIYVAPYQAEGFNLPALESLASGTPVIVPRGGSTDDFTRSKFTRYVDSSISETKHPTNNKLVNRVLKVDEASLLAEMKFVLDDFAAGMRWLKKASKAASKFALERYQWKDIVRNLLKYLAADNPCFSQILEKNGNREL